MIIESNPLLRRGLSIAAIRVLGTGLSVAVTILIARLLGSEALGIFAYANVVIALAGVPISRGWSMLLLRSVARNARYSLEAAAMNRHGIIGALGVSVVFACVVQLLVGLGAVSFSSIAPFGGWFVLLLAITLFFDQVSALRMSVLRGLDRPVLGQLPEMLIRPATIVAVLLVAWLISNGGLQVVYLFVALAMGATVAAVLGQIILSRNRARSTQGRTSRGTLRNWIASATALAGSALLVQLNGHIDILLLGGFVSADQIGIYRAGLQIAALANFGYIALNMLAAQHFSRQIGQQDSDGLAFSSNWLSRGAFIASVPLPIFLILVGEPFFELVFGKGFGPALQPALYISLGYVISSGIGMARTLLVMKHYEFLVMRATGAALAINVLLCLVLIPSHEIMGAAIANLSSAASWNLLLWWFAWRRIGIDTSIVGRDRQQRNADA